MPDSVNSLLLMPAEETVTGAPLAVRDALSEELEPTVTLPKPRLDGETASCPADVPDPESGMLRGEF